MGRFVPRKQGKQEGRQGKKKRKMSVASARERDVFTFMTPMRTDMVGQMAGRGSGSVAPDVTAREIRRTNKKSGLIGSFAMRNVSLCAGGGGRHTNFSPLFFF